MRSDAGKRRVVCVGRLYCDLIFNGLPHMPRLGEELFAEGLTLAAGGGCYITAAYLAALGRPVSLVASLPAEPFGTVVAAEMAETGIDSRFCRPPPAGTDPQMTVALVHDGDRAFVTRRVGPAIDEDNRAWLDEPDAVHLHIGELATLVEQPWLAREARARGMTVSLDCSWDDAVFREGGLSDLIAGMDVFLPNEAEAERLKECGVSLPASMITVVKKGAEGAETHHAGRCDSRAARSVKVVDTTGAGDAFNAGFLNAWLNGALPAECLETGIACGAIAVGHVGGATGLLTLNMSKGTLDTAAPAS